MSYIIIYSFPICAAFTVLRPVISDGIMTRSNGHAFIYFCKNRSQDYSISGVRVCITIALLKAQVSLQLGKIFSSDNGVSVSIMYSYMY